MGTAILSGILDACHQQERGASQESAPLPSQFIATVASEASQQKLTRHFEQMGYAGQVEVMVGDNLGAVRRADATMICVKPYLIEQVLGQDGMRNALDGKLVASIAAGVTIAQIKHLAPSANVVRAMPNTACKIREGMTAIAGPEGPSDRALLTAMFSAVGKCTFVDEKHLDVCTAMAGSGPAFTMVFIDAMVDGGVMMGLPRAQALEIAAQTVQGAARLVQETGQPPAVLKDNVTTPGGCTIAGLLRMEDGGVRGTVARTIQAATERAAELGKK
ncbi:Pro3p [Malassezia vespertilionis]|uniref:Pyrroline-5-carboxylate reductase n=2 Tax=Malassezia vespertilionis TaxID=2020962 RepID=A0A2N1JA21_9BASI|nr:Pro3p [Malassezia vespertilionis]